MPQTVPTLPEAQGHFKTREELLPILQEIVRKKGWVSEHDLLVLAKKIDLAPAEVYGVASFYSMIPLKPTGKHVIRVCKTIACDLKDRQAVLEAITSHLGIGMGETTADKRFTLQETNCIGMCEKGPAMLIDDKVFTHLTSENVVTLLRDISQNLGEYHGK